MSRFDPGFLEDIKNRVPISSVIAHRVAWDRKKTSVSRGDYWAPCPFHGEKSPSFHCEDKKGRYHCFGCGVSGDHFRFLTDLDGLTFPRAVEEIASLAGVPMPSREPLSAAENAERDRRARERDKMTAQREQLAEQERTKRVLNSAILWKSSWPLAGTLGQRYLNWRGLHGFEVEENLRFVPNLVHPVVPGLHPTILAKVVDSLGAGIGLWRIYLAADGCGKLEVPAETNAKLGLGPTAGGAVRMFGTGAHIGLCEGVETGCAVRALGWRLPIWPALSTSGMIGFIIPEGVSRVTVFPDRDGTKVRTKLKHDGTKFVAGSPGLEAATKFIERNPGRDIRIADGAANDDYLETWQRLNGLPIR